MGLFIGKFRQFLTELSAHDIKMIGYYRFTFYFFMLATGGPDQTALLALSMSS